MIRIRFLFRFAVFFLILFSSACANMRLQLMVDSMEPMLDKMNAAVNENGDVELVKDAMPAALVQLDGMVKASPENPKLLVRAAEAYNGYSFVFVEDNDKNRASKLYYKSFQYAAKALKRRIKFAQVFDGPVREFEQGLSMFWQGDVPALFWTASSWMSWAGLNVDDPEIFLALPKIKAILERCCVLDEGYKYGAAHTLLGILYATRSVAQGGNPEKAKAEFDRAFEISGRKMLVFQLMYAKYYAYQIQDKELYLRTLHEVITAPNDQFPEMAFINAAAKQKAKKLLQNVDEIF